MKSSRAREKTGWWCDLVVSAALWLVHFTLLVSMVWERLIIDLPGPEYKLHTFLLFRFFSLKKISL